MVIVPRTSRRATDSIGGHLPPLRPETLGGARRIVAIRAGCDAVAAEGTGFRGWTGEVRGGAKVRFWADDVDEGIDVDGRWVLFMIVCLRINRRACLFVLCVVGD